QRAVIVEREPDHVFLLGLRIGLRRIFGEAVGWDQAAVHRFEPTYARRRGRVADVGDRRPPCTRRWRHAPAHQNQLAYWLPSARRAMNASHFGVAILPFRGQQTSVLG